jgi:hypothetical protein
MLVSIFGMTSMIDLQTLPSRHLCACVITTPDDRTRLALPSCLRCRGKGIRDTAREKTIVRNAKRRIPTYAEFAAFDGAHCKQIYRNLPIDWQCPACRRNKYQLLRWTKLFPHTPHAYMGWAAGYHEHHDHRSNPDYRTGPPYVRSALPRFAPTVLCEQCNAADTAAKKKLKLPARFSFSSAEIAQFVIATPHGWHLHDYDIAANLYARLCLPATQATLVFWSAGGQT